MALNGYTKLSSSILASTIWREPNDTRIVWITMMALANADGVVEASIPGLADLARVPLAACEEALQTLQAPDPYSRTKDHDGRRIEPVDGGWLLLNHATYRERKNTDERREYLRVKKQESRARSRVGQHGQHLSTMVNTGQPSSTQAEAEAEAEAVVVPIEQEQLHGADAPAVEERRKAERRKTHAGHVPGFCDWLCLPKKLRDQFVGASGCDVSTPERRVEVEQRVHQWALRVREKWQGREIGDSIWQFWNYRWRERVGASTAPVATPRHVVMPDAREPEPINPERMERLRALRAEVAGDWGAPASLEGDAL